MLFIGRARTKFRYSKHIFFLFFTFESMLIFSKCLVWMVFFSFFESVTFSMHAPLFLALMNLDFNIGVLESWSTFVEGPVLLRQHSNVELVTLALSLLLSSCALKISNKILIIIYIIQYSYINLLTTITCRFCCFHYCFIYVKKIKVFCIIIETCFFYIILKFKKQLHKYIGIIYKKQIKI